MVKMEKAKNKPRVCDQLKRRIKSKYQNKNDKVTGTVNFCL